MADVFKNLLSSLTGQKPVGAADDSDFADFAGAPAPTPASAVSSAASSAASAVSATPAPWTAGMGGPRTPMHLRPYTKWYTVWERVELADFYSELIILPIILVLVFVHMWGSRKNRSRARNWIASHGPVLQQEYAIVGFEKPPKEMPVGSLNVNSTKDPWLLLKEKSLVEYASYATGRQNVAFTDIKLTLIRRHNPMALLGEEGLGFFLENQPAPRERLEATSYLFDGQENELAPLLRAKVGGDEKPEKFNSTYDSFVFAVVHKDLMKSIREARYDISLTVTKDHQKLPPWAVTMSESAEVTEALLTPELIKCLSQVESLFESLIVTDMPIDKPRSLSDALPRKRTTLSMRLPRTPEETVASVVLFTYFLRLPDQIIARGKFRPEALRRVKATREEELRKIKKAVENEKAEERREKADKTKKAEREERLRGLSGEEQRKALERERAQDLRRGQKKRSQKA